MFRKLLSLVARNGSYVERGVHVYIGPTRMIVAPVHRNLAGIYYEQPAPIVLDGPPEALPLGTAFRRAYEAFSVKDADLGSTRKSDWPAYQASGLHSMKGFERQYTTILCYALNPSNAVFRASTAHPTLADIELSVSFNPLQDEGQIGSRLLQLAHAASPQPAP